MRCSWSTDWWTGRLRAQQTTFPACFLFPVGLPAVFWYGHNIITNVDRLGLLLLLVRRETALQCGQRRVTTQTLPPFRGLELSTVADDASKVEVAQGVGRSGV